MAIRIPFIADVVDAIRGAKKLGESFDDVADALGDVDHEAKGAGDGISDVGTAAADTKRDADSMEKSFRGAFDSVRKESKSAGDGIGTDVKKGTDDAEGGLKSLKEEAGQTARESAASFSDVTSALDAIQETAANALAGFGPAGAAAGIGAAIGLGLAFSALEKNDEAALALKERIIDLAKEISDVGGDLSQIDFQSKIRDWSNEIKDNKHWWEVWQDETTTNFEDVAAKAERFGITVEDLLRGMSGSDAAAATRSLGEINKKIAEQESVIDAATDPAKMHTQQMDAAAAAAEAEAHRLGELRDELQGASGVTQKAVAEQEALDKVLGQTAATAEHAKQVQEDYASALQDTADPVSVYEGILERKNEAEQAAAQATADGTLDATDSWEQYAKAVTVTTQDLIDEWNRQATENAAFAENLAKIGAAGGQALADELRAKGPEVAAATAAAIASSGPEEQRAAIAAHAVATGAATGVAIATGISGQKEAVRTSVAGLTQGLVAPGVVVRITPDMTALERELAKQRTIAVQVAHRAGAQVAV